MNEARRERYFEMDMSANELPQNLYNIGQDNWVIIKGMDENLQQKLRRKRRFYKHFIINFKYILFMALSVKSNS